MRGSQDKAAAASCHTCMSNKSVCCAVSHHEGDHVHTCSDRLHACTQGMSSSPEMGHKLLQTSLVHIYTHRQTDDMHARRG